MKYLVLGSEGQIGHALKEYLLESGHEVLEYDLVRSPYEDLRLSNNILLEKQIFSSDFVFFLAFDVGGSRYLKKYTQILIFSPVPWMIILAVCILTAMCIASLLIVRLMVLIGS